jgi:orotidine-5'-phosphate decarboxylase
MEYKLTEKEKKAREYVCLALDISDKDEIEKAVDELWDLVGCFKIHTAFTNHGPEIVKNIIDKGGKVFLDLKFHDIPNTVANYAEAVTKLGVSYFNMHVSGGSEMMKAASKRVIEISTELDIEAPKMIGMTVLTSISKDVLNNEIGIQGEIEDKVLAWAKLAKEAKLDGIVCSAADLDRIKGKLPEDFFYITPGIRPVGVNHDDQVRVMTPSNAVRAGSSLLVIGRAIYKAEDRRKAAYEILQDIASVI